MNKIHLAAVAALLASPVLPAIEDHTATAPAPATPPAAAAEAAKPAAPAPAAAAPTAAELAAADPALRKEQAQLALENSLAAERLNRELADLRAETQRLKTEREALTERLALETAKRQSDELGEIAKLEAEKLRLERESLVSKMLAEKLTSDLKAQQAQSGLEVSRLEAEIQSIEARDKRRQFADADPVYLANPLKDDGTLVISDRRISLNGAITGSTADHVTTRIHYFNNLNREQPIFIVIDDSPGGSVLAGYRILKAMDSSAAPIHVVVKSFAASMAATIATLAEHSYALPNALILHHQISNRFVVTQLNLTQQKEQYARAQEFWRRLAGPVAAKMGVTLDEFIKRMYENDSNGDWVAFADQARELKWVDHVISGVDETALRTNPDGKPAPAVAARTISGLKEELDADGRPVIYLPRTNPLDVYFLYDPVGTYQLR